LNAINVLDMGQINKVFIIFDMTRLVSGKRGASLQLAAILPRPFCLAAMPGVHITPTVLLFT
jgi:hypothetical protein